jgi:hypothetical protein
MSTFNGLPAHTLFTTPITASAGAWLGARVGVSPAFTTHQQLGETLVYITALAAAIALPAAVQIREACGRTVEFALIRVREPHGAT